jgi:hypothetical protein
VWIGPDEDAPSDDGELSENTESGADTTDQDVTVESIPGNRQGSAQPSPELTPQCRSRVSNLAAARGLGIHVTSSADALRHAQAAGLPTSPRPLGSPPSAVNAQEVLTLGSSSTPSQQQR